MPLTNPDQLKYHKNLNGRDMDYSAWKFREVETGEEFFCILAVQRLGDTLSGGIALDIHEARELRDQLDKFIKEEKVRIVEAGS